MDNEEYCQIFQIVSEDSYRACINLNVDKLKGLISESIRNSINFVLAGRHQEGGYAIWQVGSCSRLTNDPDDYDLDFEVAFFRTQMGLKQQTIAEIINLTVLNICKSNDVKACKVRRNSGMNVESIVIEFNDGATNIKSDIQFHIHKKYIKDQQSAPQVIQRRIKMLSIDEYGCYSQEREAMIRANIIYVKRLLKRYGCYKFNSQRQRIGFGGTGVETWLLQHNGSIVEAFQAFRDASFDSDGNLLEFKEFQNNYSIYAGFTNPYGGELKKDFVKSLLKEEGWLAILKLISEIIEM